MKIISNGKEISIVGAQGPQGPDGNPVGTVIAYMGKTAPDGYLTCDGAVYNISAYPALAALFRLQFGSANHFGGNGESTFTVPDLRNLFLRGYHGDLAEQLSGEIGVKQDATQIQAFNAVKDSVNTYIRSSNLGGSNFDTETKSGISYDFRGGVTLNSNAQALFSSRPVNMAVLYCIKAT